MATDNEPTTITIEWGEEGEHFDTLAEPTDTPGLFITPQIAGRYFTGKYVITHQATGQRVGIFGGPYDGAQLDTARRVATAMGTIGVDWTDDRDAILAQIAAPGIREAAQAASYAAKYPPVEPDEEGTPGPSTSRWPRTEAQATARQMAAAYTHLGLESYRDFMALTGQNHDTPEKKQNFKQAAALMIAEYAIVALLRNLIAADADAADAAARDLWSAVTTGDSIGEWLAEWGTEYGLDPNLYSTDV